MPLYPINKKPEHGPGKMRFAVSGGGKGGN